MLFVGIENKESKVVTVLDTAKTVQSGGLDVLATPVLAALMEKTAWESVLSYMEEGRDTVGVLLTVEHLSPTPINMKIECFSKLIEINLRELVFEIIAYDEKGLIAKAHHKRVIIDKEKFQNKANTK